MLGHRLGPAAGDPIPPLRRLAIRAADRTLGPMLPTRPSDSQCGFRIYPGAFLREVPLVEDGFVLETEALVRATWAGYRLVSVPIRSVYPRGRRSRFHAVPDVARIAWYLARVSLGARRTAGRLGRHRRAGRPCRGGGLRIVTSPGGGPSWASRGLPLSDRGDGRAGPIPSGPAAHAMAGRPAAAPTRRSW